MGDPWAVLAGKGGNVENLTDRERHWNYQEIQKVDLVTEWNARRLPRNLKDIPKCLGKRILTSAGLLFIIVKDDKIATSGVQRKESSDAREGSSRDFQIEHT